MILRCVDDGHDSEERDFVGKEVNQKSESNAIWKTRICLLNSIPRWADGQRANSLTLPRLRAQRGARS